jgi:filamentous hemagglutinin family protein
MTVVQETQNAIINWSDFSVASGNSVAFTGGNATLNRVTTANPSVIAGTVTGDHALFFVNPNGILVSGTMTAPTLVLSTLGITDTDFNNGNYTFNRGGATGAITNSGTIGDGAMAGNIGVAALFAATVTNTNIINANNMTIVAAESVKLDATTANVAGGVYDAASNGYSGVSDITASAISTSITNSSYIKTHGNGGDSGKIDIHSTNGMIDNGGSIDIEVYNSGASGAITLTASGDILNNNGSIGSYTGATGAAAGAVTLTAGGTIESSGGGGYIGSYSDTGASGAVTLTAGETIDNSGGYIESSSSTGASGAVTLITAGGDILNTNGNIYTSTIGAAEGAITLTAAGTIDNRGGNIKSSSNAGASGAVTLTAGGHILNTNGQIASYNNGGDSGAVTVVASGDIISTGDGYIYSYTEGAGAVSAAVTVTSGGTIDISDNGGIYSYGTSNAGDVTLTAPALIYTTYADSLTSTNNKSFIASVNNQDTGTGTIRLRADTVNGAAMSTLSAADFEQSSSTDYTHDWFGNLAFEPLSAPVPVSVPEPVLTNLTEQVTEQDEIHDLIGAGVLNIITPSRAAPAFAGQTRFTVGSDITGVGNGTAHSTVIPGVFVVAEAE